MAQRDWILLVHLGPVQDFIASARKCRDMWFGSYLLSELSKAAANGIAGCLTDAGARKEDVLVFPGKLDDSKSNVANKLQLIVTGTDDFVRDVAEAGRMAMQRTLEENFAKPVFRQVAEEFGEDFYWGTASKHIDDLMEYMWVAVPLAKDQSDYAAQRSCAEGLLAARKNSRQWTAASGNDLGVPKSSLDGLRESVLHERVYDQFRDDPERLRRAAGVGEAERLCGVGLMKRLAKPLYDRERSEWPPVFHSAGHIASAGVRARIASSEDAKGALSDYLETLERVVAIKDLEIRAHERVSEEELSWKVAIDSREAKQFACVPRVLGTRPAKTGLDGVVLYPSRSARIAKEYGVDASALAEITAAQDKLLCAAGISEPNPYYALLLGDGDKMGVALDEMSSAEEHQRFSEKLDAEFAVECRDLVNGYGGSLLYAGGDDVLAMVPLFHALPCALKLRDQFNKAMTRAIDAPLGGKLPTLSIGLAVCHYLEPLGRVREYAKMAERAAKNSAGRDALAVLVKKRGSVEKLVYGKWDSGLAERLHSWGELQASGAVSRSMAHKFEEAVQPIDPIRFMGRQRTGNEDDVKMVRSLLRRVALRRDLEDEPRKALRALIEKYLTIHADPYEAVRQLSHELQIADLFGRSMREVWGAYPNLENAEVMK